MFLGQIFLLVDLRYFFQILGQGDKKNNKKNSENDQLTGHFQSFFFLLFLQNKHTASNLCLLLQKEQNVKGGEGPSGKQAVGINNGTR